MEVGDIIWRVQADAGDNLLEMKVERYHYYHRTGYYRDNGEYTSQYVENTYYEVGYRIRNIVTKSEVELEGTNRAKIKEIWKAFCFAHGLDFVDFRFKKPRNEKGYI